MKNKSDIRQTAKTHLSGARQLAQFLPWERDPDMCDDSDSIWTAAFVTGGGAEDLYDMCVVGEPDHNGPASWDVTGVRDGVTVIFGSGEAASFEAACHSAAIAARRASMRVVPLSPSA